MTKRRQTRKQKGETSKAPRKATRTQENQDGPGMPDFRVPNDRAMLVPTLPPDIAPGTSAANAFLLVQAGFGSICRYVPKVGWRLYTPQQGRWVTAPESDQLLHIASDLLQPIVTEYIARLPRGSKAQHDELHAWWKQVGNTATLTYSLRFASGLPELILDAGAWNPDAHLLNVQNGVLNLRDGTLSAHSPAYLMTEQAQVTYQPGARHPTFDDFLNTLRQQGTEDFLSRAAGRALSGRIEAEEFLLLLGDGGTGKGTFVSALTAMLGSYAVAMPIQSLVLNPRGEGGNAANPFVMHTIGKRLVVANEVPEKAVLNAALIKELTGRDLMSVREVYGKAVDYRPQFALWIQSNFPLLINTEDSGLKRRLRVVPFHHKPAHLRENYKRELQQPEALSAMLNWALDGYRKWFADGEHYDPGDLTVIGRATDTHWEALTPLLHFAGERLISDHEAFLSTQEIKGVAAEWLEEQGQNGNSSPTDKEISRALTKMGFRNRTKDGKVRGWRARWRADE